jgi:hypothetical protein
MLCKPATPPQAGLPLADVCEHPADDAPRLDLNNNAIGLEGARALAHAPQLDNLVHLDVTRNSLPEEARELLCGRFGERVRVKTSWE